MASPSGGTIQHTGRGIESRLSSAGQQASRPSSSSTANLRSQWATLASPAKQLELVVRSKSALGMNGVAEESKSALQRMSDAISMLHRVGMVMYA